MRHEHEMPFGVRSLEGGRVCFRLWAPKAKDVRLCLAKDNRALPMKAEADGWFELITDAARAGSLYRYQIDGGQEVPDPASRFQPEDVHGYSEVVDPEAFDWKETGWKGRPWQQTVLYELHVGTFSSEGTYAGVEAKLDYLGDLGITAVELMPLADFAGRWNWGYDGVLPYAPDSSYGRPEDLKRLIQAAHGKGFMMFLDVVYNHLGPDGNYLQRYAPDFVTNRHASPWGEGINFDGPRSRVVRDYFIHNAMYWLEEYQFDGLRLDAVHAITDDSQPDILTELARTVRKNFEGKRHVHLVLENEKNEAKYLDCGRLGQSRRYDAQWDDDFHHALHVAVTGETDGYYRDYAKAPIWQLGRCLAEGFAFQGDISEYRRGEKRGEVSKDLSPSDFVIFLQNHDQVGNRAFGDRIGETASAAALKAAMAILLLAPSPPMLFMGEEFGAKTPFLFFSDFKGDLAKAVREGRRSEFKSFARFADASARAAIPDPNAEDTFVRSKLDWGCLPRPEHAEWLGFYRELLSLRREIIVPLVNEVIPGAASFRTFVQTGLEVVWRLSSGRVLRVTANLGNTQAALPEAHSCAGQIIYHLRGCRSVTSREKLSEKVLDPWAVIWQLHA